MPTHQTTCIVCGVPCYCTNDEHMLGCGGTHGEGGCENPPYIEFCSIRCLQALTQRLIERAIAWQHRNDGGE